MINDIRYAITFPCFDFLMMGSADGKCNVVSNVNLYANSNNPAYLNTCNHSSTLALPACDGYNRLNPAMKNHVCTDAISGFTWPMIDDLPMCSGKYGNGYFVSN